jgi:signal transduction histidine kinase/CheY-like chemotaxis protein
VELRTFEIMARPISGSDIYDEGTLTEYYVMVLSDVTAERQVRAELAQQERLAAVGQLAAGIAHDFNNILAVIVLYAQMDVDEPDLPPRIRSHVETIIREANHAANLVEQILDFGRRAVLTPSPMDMVPFLKEQVKLLEHTLPESIVLDLHLDVSHLVIRADPTRMRQVITNLAVNARDAMPKGGHLTLRLGRVVVHGREDAPLSEVGVGAWMKLTVRDTGAGMSDEVRQHLFEPFYTTKGPGAGTGLGLAQVYGIVKQHQGAVDVQTAIGEGTAFHIYLPATDAGDLTQPDAEVEFSQEGQGEMILVVEDDASLREALVNALELLGYRTREAAHGREALAQLAGSPDGAGSKIDLVLSDLVMPEMGGQALFYALHEQGMPCPMVIISGHPMRRELRTLEARGLSGWLLKPVQMDKLAALVAKALSASA